jgi:uncharacterized RDD family membrane protein YckC
MQIYIIQNSRQTGPFDAEQIMEMIRNRKLRTTDMVWHEQLSEWTEAGKVFDFSAPAQEIPPAVQKTVSTRSSSVQGQVSAFDPRKRYQEHMNAVESKASVPADRMQRLFASIIDSLIFTPIAVVTIIGGGLSSFIGSASGTCPAASALPVLLLGVAAIFALVIFQLVLLSMSGQTIGKKIMAIKIVTSDGEHLPGFFKVVLLRLIVVGLIGSIPFAGWIFNLVDILFIFRDDRRCIHDMIAGTKVIKKAA